MALIKRGANRTIHRGVGGYSIYRRRHLGGAGGAKPMRVPVDPRLFEDKDVQWSMIRKEGLQRSRRAPRSSVGAMAFRWPKFKLPDFGKPFFGKRLNETERAELRQQRAKEFENVHPIEGTQIIVDILYRRLAESLNMDFFKADAHNTIKPTHHLKEDLNLDRINLAILRSQLSSTLNIPIPKQDAQAWLTVNDVRNSLIVAVAHARQTGSFLDVL